MEQNEEYEPMITKRDLLHWFSIYTILFLLLKYYAIILIKIDFILSYIEYIISITIGVENFVNLFLSVVFGFFLLLLLGSTNNSSQVENNEMNVPEEFEGNEDEYWERYYEAFPELQ